MTAMGVIHEECPGLNLDAEFSLASQQITSVASTVGQIGHRLPAPIRGTGIR